MTPSGVVVISSVVVTFLPLKTLVTVERERQYPIPPSEVVDELVITPSPPPELD